MSSPIFRVRAGILFYELINERMNCCKRPVSFVGGILCKMMTFCWLNINTGSNPLDWLALVISSTLFSLSLFKNAMKKRKSNQVCVNKIRFEPLFCGFLKSQRCSLLNRPIDHFVRWIIRSIPPFFFSPTFLCSPLEFEIFLENMALPFH